MQEFSKESAKENFCGANSPMGCRGRAKQDDVVKRAPVKPQMMEIRHFCSLY